MAASALYACTKCTQRYPFEELSQGQQLYKVRGRWVAGGRVSSAVARGSWVPVWHCSPPPPLSVSPRWRLGGLEFSPPHPETRFSEDLGIRWESP